MLNTLTFSRRVVATALLGMTASIAVVGSAHAASPANITPPADAQLVATTAATGVQVYSCEFDSAHQLAWVFKSPLASLYDGSGQLMIHHAAGPSWQSTDGSKITGHVLAQAPSATPNSIPQLLLETKPVAGAGALANIRFVQRLDTVAGTAPAQPCTVEHQAGEAPYFAHYVFWK